MPLLLAILLAATSPPAAEPKVTFIGLAAVRVTDGKASVILHSRFQPTTAFAAISRRTRALSRPSAARFSRS